MKDKKQKEKRQRTEVEKDSRSKKKCKNGGELPERMKSILDPQSFNLALDHFSNANPSSSLESLTKRLREGGASAFELAWSVYNSESHFPRKREYFIEYCLDSFKKNPSASAESLQFWTFLEVLLVQDGMKPASASLIYSSVKAPIFPVFEMFFAHLLATYPSHGSASSDNSLAAQTTAKARNVFDAVVQYHGWMKCNLEQYLLFLSNGMTLLCRITENPEWVAEQCALLSSATHYLSVIDGSNAKKSFASVVDLLLPIGLELLSISSPSAPILQVQLLINDYIGSTLFASALTSEWKSLALLWVSGSTTEEPVSSFLLKLMPRLQGLNRSALHAGLPLVFKMLLGSKNAESSSVFYLFDQLCTCLPSTLIANQEDKRILTSVIRAMLDDLAASSLFRATNEKVSNLLLVYMDQEYSAVLTQAKEKGYLDPSDMSMLSGLSSVDPSAALKYLDDVLNLIQECDNELSVEFMVRMVKIFADARQFDVFFGKWASRLAGSDQYASFILPTALLSAIKFILKDLPSGQVISCLQVLDRCFAGFLTEISTTDKQEGVSNHPAHPYLLQLLEEALQISAPSESQVKARQQVLESLRSQFVLPIVQNTQALGSLKVTALSVHLLLTVYASEILPADEALDKEVFDLDTVDQLENTPIDIVRGKLILSSLNMSSPATSMKPTLSVENAKEEFKFRASLAKRQRKAIRQLITSSCADDRLPFWKDIGQYLPAISDLLLSAKDELDEEMIHALRILLSSSSSAVVFNVFRHAELYEIRALQKHLPALLLGEVFMYDMSVCGLFKKKTLEKLDPRGSNLKTLNQFVQRALEKGKYGLEADMNEESIRQLVSLISPKLELFCIFPESFVGRKEKQWVIALLIFFEAALRSYSKCPSNILMRTRMCWVKLVEQLNCASSELFTPDLMVSVLSNLTIADVRVMSATVSCLQNIILIRLKNINLDQHHLQDHVLSDICKHMTAEISDPQSSLLFINVCLEPICAWLKYISSGKKGHNTITFAMDILAAPFSALFEKLKSELKNIVKGKDINDSRLRALVTSAKTLLQLRSLPSMPATKNSDGLFDQIMALLPENLQAKSDRLSFFVIACPVLFEGLSSRLDMASIPRIVHLSWLASSTGLLNASDYAAMWKRLVETANEPAYEAIVDAHITALERLSAFGTDPLILHVLQSLDIIVSESNATCSKSSIRKNLAMVLAKLTQLAKASILPTVHLQLVLVCQSIARDRFLVLSTLDISMILTCIRSSIIQGSYPSSLMHFGKIYDEVCKLLILLVTQRKDALLNAMSSFVSICHLLLLKLPRRSALTVNESDSGNAANLARVWMSINMKSIVIAGPQHHSQHRREEEEEKSAELSLALQKIFGKHCAFLLSTFVQMQVSGQDALSFDAQTSLMEGIFALLEGAGEHGKNAVLASIPSSSGSAKTFFKELVSTWEKGYKYKGRM